MKLASNPSQDFKQLRRYASKLSASTYDTKTDVLILVIPCGESSKLIILEEGHGVNLYWSKNGRVGAQVADLFIACSGMGVYVRLTLTGHDEKFPRLSLCRLSPISFFPFRTSLTEFWWFFSPREPYGIS